MGYKLHVLRDARCPPPPDQWTPAGPKTSEQAVAPGLLRAWAAAVAGLRVRWPLLFGHLLADNGYDANALYELAASPGLQLLAPPKPTARGIGHRRNSPHRLRGLELCRGCNDRGRGARGGSTARRHPLDPPGRAGVPPSFGQSLMRERGGIERTFGLRGNWGGGMGPLPNWVRRPRRVALWVAGKMILNGARYALKNGLLPETKQRLAA